MMKYFALLLALPFGVPAADAPGRMETVSLVAADSHGNPVGDLTGGDFEVFENGKPQQIVSFRHSDTRSSRPTPLAPDEYSNRTGTDTGHATAVLFDLLNEHLEARGPAWEMLVRALEPLESSQGLYLYILTMNGRLFPVHGMPDPEKEPPPPETTPWTRQIRPIMNDAMRAVTMVRPPEMWVDERIRLTYDALGALAARLAGFPGRKNIVWITHGVPISLSPAVTGTDWIDYTPYLRRLSERLDRENVSIYPVQQIPPGMAMTGPDTQHSGIGDEDTLQQFARYTGGRANGGSDIKEAIHQAMNDVRTGYQIGYYPSPQNWDGKFHKLKVTCARKGVRIQVKEGYYAWPEEPFTEDRQKDTLQSALTALMDAGEIGIRVRATPSVKDANSLELAVRVDPADVLLKQEGNQFTGELRFALASVNADGAARSSAMAAMHLKLSPEQHDQILKNGITFQDALAVPAGAQKIRLAILDADRGAVGSVTVPVGQVR